MKKDVALLIFARTSQEESKHKAFKASKEFFEYQNKQVLQLAKSTKLDYFWIDEDLQIGFNFQERYLNAIQNVFEKGYQRIISIGNDSPELKASHIKAAAQVLEQQDMCFGPSKDGGFYLWGLHKKVFHKDNFLNFSWKTEKLLSELIHSLTQKSITVCCLEKLYDVDAPRDALHLLSSKTLAARLKAILLKMLNTQAASIVVLLPNLSSTYKSHFYNKGSPQAA